MLSAHTSKLNLPLGTFSYMSRAFAMQLSRVVANNKLLNNVDRKQKKKGRVGGTVSTQPSRVRFHSVLASTEKKKCALNQVPSGGALPVIFLYKKMLSGAA